MFRLLRSLLGVHQRADTSDRLYQSKEKTALQSEHGGFSYSTRTIGELKQAVYSIYILAYLRNFRKSFSTLSQQLSIESILS